VDQFFSETKAIADDIEGMLSPFSMAVIDSLLALQQQRCIRGDAMEMGVFRGKSAAVIGRRMGASETLRLFDIENYFDRDRVARSGATIDFSVRNTSRLFWWNLRKHRKSVRFCHIDASHTFDATMHEMALADYVLSDNGVLILDDYTNLHYSQILAATFKYLFTTRTNLVLFLVTGEKAYLCRRDAFPLYAQFVLGEMRSQMSDRGAGDICVARTDISTNYRAFYVREKQPGEADDFYSPATYSDFHHLRPPSLRDRIKLFVRGFRNQIIRMI
jgi:hypothetical protein